MLALPVLSADECTRQCTRAAGSDSAFCPKVCSATCAQRCGDLLRRVGSDLGTCADLCARSCDDLEKTFDFPTNMCGWMIENRPDPELTPRELLSPDL